MHNKWMVLCGLLMAMTFTRVASAGQGGRLTNAQVPGHFEMQAVTQVAGATWTFTTSNLSPGSDTVIHVQNLDDAQGGFIAGNDDSGGTLASSVVVPPASTTRTLLVLVRAYDATSAGTCTFTGSSSPNFGGSFNISNATFGGAKYPLNAGLAANSHVTTAEVNGTLQGASNTTLLMIGGSAANGIAWDDDDGVDHMSWLHTNVACTFPCYMVVANVVDTGMRATNLIWDEDAHTADPDGDGLGDGLEVAIGTSSASADSDQDGIDDYAELLGQETSPPLKFPAWGADPALKDLFIEFDWATVACAPMDTACHHDNFKAGMQPGTPPPAVLASDMKGAFAPVRTHLDLGIDNPDPATALDWGNWGGAEELTSTSPAACEGFTQARHGTFHHVISGVATFSGVGYGCTFANAFPWTLAHELGHGIGLEHGGRPFAGQINLKLNYPSTLNYLYYDFIFSHGTLPTLNPAALNETLGLNTTDARVLGKVRDVLCPSGICISGQAIDWNRDGIFSPATVTVAGTPIGSYTQFGRGVRTSGTLTDPSLAWVTAGAQGNQLWTFGHGPTNRLRYVRLIGATMNSACAVKNAAITVEDGGSDCASLASATVVENTAISTTLGIGAAELAGASSPTMLAVWQPPTGSLRWSTIGINASTNAVTFGTSTQLPGNFTTADDVTALSTGTNAVKVWARSGSRLKEWTYQNGGWGQPVDQRWNDGTTNGTLITVTFGIGATRGYQDGGSSLSTYAAIPTSNGVVEFARQGSNGRWTKLDIWSDIGERPVVRARPGLAYGRTQIGGPNNVGRFYMSVTPTATCASLPPNYPFGDAATHRICEAKLIKTEGNLTTGTSRRLVWISPSIQFGGYGPDESRIPLRGSALVNDLSRDTNLKGVKNYQTGEFEFLPLADGQFNADLKDVDDFQYLQGCLSSSVKSVPPAPFVPCPLP